MCSGSASAVLHNCFPDSAEEVSQKAELGKDRVLAIVLDGNVPAMKVQLKSGFEELGVFYLGKIFGIKFCSLKKKQYDAK